MRHIGLLGCSLGHICNLAIIVKVAVYLTFKSIWKWNSDCTIHFLDLDVFRSKKAAICNKARTASISWGPHRRTGWSSCYSWALYSVSGDFYLEKPKVLGFFFFKFIRHSHCMLS